MPEPTGIWLRVSSGGQDEANQEPDLERYCQEHDYLIEHRYEVHGKSAYHGQQQADLDQALADMRAGVIKVLVIWHSDRIERRPGKALLDVLAEFGAAGGRVESVQEPTLGQLDFGGQVTTFIAGLVNHEKSKHIAEQVGLAHDRIRAAGALGAGGIPWGYESAGEKYGRRLVPSPEGRKYVPEIYNRVIAGESQATVAAWLCKETGLPWWLHTVGRLVRNPVYRGHRCEVARVTDPATGKMHEEHGRVLHRCEPLVDAATWRRANEARKSRPKRGPANAANRAMLAGAIYCPRCEDSPMYRVMAGRATCRTAYYRCSGRGAARKGCGNMVRCELADAAVSKIAARRFWVLKETERTLIPGTNYEAELAEVDYELQHLSRDLPAADYIAEVTRLMAERDRLSARPSVPDRWEVTETGRTYDQLWEALDPAERGPWLVRQGFRVTATREAVTLTQEDPAGGLPFLATVALNPQIAGPPAATDGPANNTP